jgi:hypothetical protein
MMPSSKVCSLCRKDKPSSDYHRNRKEKSGLQPRCKVCISTYYRKRYDENKTRYSLLKEIQERKSRQNICLLKEVQQGKSRKGVY